MRELRRRCPGSLENQNVLESIRQMVLAANDVGDAQVGVVGARGQVIGGHAIGTQQGEVFDVGGGFYLLTVNRIGEAHWLRAFAGDAKTQREWFSRGGAAVAFGARKL